MFFFPISKWVGGIFFEHIHRLDASLVAFLTTILAFLVVWAHIAPAITRDRRLFFMAAGAVLSLVFPTHAAESLLLSGIGLAAFVAGLFWPNCEPAPKWLRVLGVAAFAAVVAQGVLGGLRVTELKDALGIFHAALAQTIFPVGLLHRIVPDRFLAASAHSGGNRSPSFSSLVHFNYRFDFNPTHPWRDHPASACRACHPGFPAAYGKIWPDTSAAAIARYNQNRQEVFAYHPITAAQVELQMVHRILALLILAAVAHCVWHTRRNLGFATLVDPLFECLVRVGFNSDFSRRRHHLDG